MIVYGFTIVHTWRPDRALDLLELELEAWLGPAQQPEFRAPEPM